MSLVQPAHVYQGDARDDRVQGFQPAKQHSYEFDTLRPWLQRDFPAIYKLLPVQDYQVLSVAI